MKSDGEIMEILAAYDLTGSFTTTNNAAPPLPADLEALMRSLKMPHARALAPDLIATARAQRWEPVEVIKALFTEEAASGPVHARLPPQSSRLPDRENLRRLGPGRD